MKELLTYANLWPKGSTASRLAEALLVAISITYALPTAIAVFPPQTAISTAKLGPEFDSIRKQGVKTLYFDRSI
jgi:hypothetical protein